MIFPNTYTFITQSNAMKTSLKHLNMLDVCETALRRQDYSFNIFSFEPE